MPGHAPNNSSPSSASLTLAAALLDLGLRRGLAAAFLAAALLDLGLAAAFLAALERFFRVLLFWDMFWKLYVWCAQTRRARGAALPVLPVGLGTHF